MHNASRSGTGHNVSRAPTNPAHTSCRMRSNSPNGFAGDKGACMFTRRELLIVVLASAVTVLATVGIRAAAPVLSSSVFDWNAMTVETTDVGARRTVFRAPTAT